MPCSRLVSVCYNHADLGASDTTDDRPIKLQNPYLSMDRHAGKETGDVSLGPVGKDSKPKTDRASELMLVVEIKNGLTKPTLVAFAYKDSKIVRSSTYNTLECNPATLKKDLKLQKTSDVIDQNGIPDMVSMTALFRMH